MKIKSILSILILVLSLGAGAQESLTPNNKSFQKRWIKEHSYSMKWFAVKETGKVQVATVLTYVQTRKDTLSIITTVNMNNMKPWTDTTVAVRATLRPIYHSSYNMQRDMVLHFADEVTGFYNDKTQNKNMAVHDAPTSQYFDSNLYPQLLGWLPLAEGYKCLIPIYDYVPTGASGIRNISVTDVKSGIYQSVKNGLRQVWIVTVTDGDSRLTFNFDQLDRRLWRQDINAGGRQMFMQREE